MAAYGNKVKIKAVGTENEDKVKSKVVATGKEDSLTIVINKQDAALKRLEAKHGPGYGKPPPGSKSEARGIRYQDNCMKEIIELCAIISERGCHMKDGQVVIRFKDLFLIYRVISDKCVGILLRARRYKLLTFEGETLFQGQNDETLITLLRPFFEIQGHFKETKQLIKPEEVFIAPPSVKTIEGGKKIKKKKKESSPNKHIDESGTVPKIELNKDESVEDSSDIREKNEEKTNTDSLKNSTIVRTSSFRTKEKEAEVSLQFDVAKDENTLLNEENETKMSNLDLVLETVAELVAGDRSDHVQTSVEVEGDLGLVWMDLGKKDSRAQIKVGECKDSVFATITLKEIPQDDGEEQEPQKTPKEGEGELRGGNESQDNEMTRL